jgi:hypothetical protein
MRAACARAGIKPAVSFHILRHTWASLAVMNELGPSRHAHGREALWSLGGKLRHRGDPRRRAALRRGAGRIGEAPGAPQAVEANDRHPRSLLLVRGALLNANGSPRGALAPRVVLTRAPGECKPLPQYPQKPTSGSGAISVAMGFQRTCQSPYRMSAPRGRAEMPGLASTSQFDPNNLHLALKVHATECLAAVGTALPPRSDQSADTFD